MTHKPYQYTMKNLQPIVLFLTMVLISCEKKPDNFNIFCPDLVINYNQQSSWTGWRYNLTITYPDTLIIYERTLVPKTIEKTSKYHVDKSTMDSLFLDL